MLELGRNEEAAEVLHRIERQLETERETLVHEIPVQCLRAALLHARGDLVTARHELALGIRELEDEWGGDHGMLFEPLRKAGRIEIELGEHHRAAAHLERALAIAERSDFSLASKARARLQLANAQKLMGAPESGFRQATRARYELLGDPDRREGELDAFDEMLSSFD